MRGCAVADRDERRRTLEEVVRLLESARTGPTPDHDQDFDDGRVDSYVVAALSAARSALNVASGRGDTAEMSPRPER
jgi:hypothetical protein